MVSPQSQTTIIPQSQQPLVTRTYPSESELDVVIERAAAAQKLWSRLSVQERVAIGAKFMEEFRNMSEEIPVELTLQMGRPVSRCPGEILGTLEHAEYMLSIAESCLADVSLKETDKPGFRRFIKRVPLDVVLVIAPWDNVSHTAFPSVDDTSAFCQLSLPHHRQLGPSCACCGPLTAERSALAFSCAGLPADLLQVMHMSPELAAHAVQHPSVNFVLFTGSIIGGRSVAQNAASTKGFKGVGLELGGKDPAYVRADANLGLTPHTRRDVQRGTELLCG